MRTLLKFFFAAFRWFCYLCLAVGIITIAIAILLPVFELCSNISFSADPICKSDFDSGLMTFAIVIIYMSVFAGLPIIFALTGFLFAAHAAFKRFNRSESDSESTNETSQSAVSTSVKFLRQILP